MAWTGHEVETGIQDCLHVTYYFIISSNGVVYLDRLSGARYYVSRPANGCSSYTHISYHDITKVSEKLHFFNCRGEGYRTFWVFCDVIYGCSQRCFFWNFVDDQIKVISSLLLPKSWLVHLKKTIAMEPYCTLVK